MLKEISPGQHTRFDNELNITYLDRPLIMFIPQQQYFNSAGCKFNLTTIS